MRYLRPPQRSGFFWDNPIRMTPFQVPACCPNTNGINDAMPTEGFRPTSCSFPYQLIPARDLHFSLRVHRPTWNVVVFLPRKRIISQKRKDRFSQLYFSYAWSFFFLPDLGLPDLCQIFLLIFFFGSSQSSRAEEADVSFHHNFLAGPNTDLGGCAEHPSKASPETFRSSRERTSAGTVLPRSRLTLEHFWAQQFIGFLRFYEGSGYVCFFGHFRGCAIAA